MTPTQHPPAGNDITRNSNVIPFPQQEHLKVIPIQTGSDHTTLDLFRLSLFIEAVCDRKSLFHSYNINKRMDMIHEHVDLLEALADHDEESALAVFFTTRVSRLKLEVPQSSQAFQPRCVDLSLRLSALRTSLISYSLDTAQRDR